MDALLDFTAGYAERLYIADEGVKNDEEKRKKLFEHLKDEKEHHSLMCCAVTVECCFPDRFVTSKHHYIVKFRFTVTSIQQSFRFRPD